MLCISCVIQWIVTAPIIVSSFLFLLLVYCKSICVLLVNIKYSWILMFLLCFSCQEKQQEREMENRISEKAPAAEKSDLLEREIKRNGLSSVAETEAFLDSVFVHQEVDPNYKVELAESLIQSDFWNKISYHFQDDILVYLGQNYIALDSNRKAIHVFETLLENYLPQLQQDPQAYLLANLELSTAYSNIQKYDLVVDYTNMGIKVAQKYPDKIKTSDYLVAYNNLLYYANKGNICEAFARYRTDKLHYFDRLPAISAKDADFSEIIYKKYEIMCLLAQVDTLVTLRKLSEFKNYQPRYKDFLLRKAEYYLSVYASVIDKYYFELKDYERALSLATSFYEESQQYPEMPHYQMLALSKMAISLKALNLNFESNQYLDVIQSKIHPNPYSTSYYSLKIIRALNLSEMNKHREVVAILDSVFPLLSEHLMGRKITITSLKNQDYHAFNSDYVINIFSSASNLYLRAFRSNHDTACLEKGESLAIAALKMFHYFYKNGKYDESTARLAANIQESFLYLLTTKYKDNKAKQVELIDGIEKISSQQLFNQFQQQVIVSNPALQKINLERSKVLSKIESLEEQLFFAVDNVKAVSKKELYRQLSQLDEQLKLELKNFATINKDFSIKKIQDALRGGEVILKYYGTPDNIYRLLIAPDHLVVENLGKAAVIEKEVKKYLAALEYPASDYREGAKNLFHLLCEDIPANQVSIIPQGFINYLPFETLINEKNKNWIVAKNIHYNFSLPLWYAGRVYNYPLSSPATLCLAADYTQSLLGTQPLKYSGKEIEKIAAITDGKKNNKATKSYFMQHSADYSICHLAMHARLDDANFEQSNLLFSNDEPLYFKDFYNLNLPLEMVVLSACNTGVGSIVNGEGIMSLSRALTFSGVRSSVVSYWEVPDKETAALMELFYKQLKKGKRNAVALADAKREFIQKYPLKNHPYFWAGFVLNGANDAVYPVNYGFAFLMALGLLTILFLWYYRKLI